MWYDGQNLSSLLNNIHWYFISSTLLLSTIRRYIFVATWLWLIFWVDIKFGFGFVVNFITKTMFYMIKQQYFTSSICFHGLKFGNFSIKPTCFHFFSPTQNSSKIYWCIQFLRHTFCSSLLSLSIDQFTMQHWQRTMSEQMSN